MSSLPPQQRRSPNRQQTPDEPSQQIQHGSTEDPAGSIASSQAVLLNGPTVDSKPTDTKTRQEDGAFERSQPPPTSTDAPDRCWICFGEPSEDKTPKTWRHPCKCSLPAHESCLLDWIADLESPDSNKSAARHAKIHCPNCQSEIRLARPTSRAVELYSILEQMEGKALLPATVAGLSYMLLLAFSHHGAYTIRTIFGDHDASVILQPRPYVSWNWFERQTALYFPNAARPFWREWRGLRVEFGLPLIPIALIASRTRLGDAALPFLPIAFFATHPVSSETLHIGYWPPSAALSLVMLPYVRSVYNEAMERVWGERERAWAKEVKPNLGADGSETGDVDGQGEDRQEDGDVEEVIQIELDLNIGDDDEDSDEDAESEHETDEEQRPQDRPTDQQEVEIEMPEAGMNDPVAAAAAANEQLERIEQQDRQRNEGQRRQNNGQRHDFERHFDLIKSAQSIAETVFGALLFPTVSSLSGELLRLLLPASWVTLPASRRPGGLLQTKWGRSIVGGCLFVVLKDAFRIYCRWKAAMSFRERRVRDFDTKRGVYL